MTTTWTPDGVGELFCLATTLLDQRTHPAQAIAEVYPKRWTASETTIGENKTLIIDAGPSRGPILRSGEPDRSTPRRCRSPATRYEITRSITPTPVTAKASMHALTAPAERASRAVLTRLNTTGRDRHSDRRRKHQPSFPVRNRPPRPSVARPWSGSPERAEPRWT